MTMTRTHSSGPDGPGTTARPDQGGEPAMGTVTVETRFGSIAFDDSNSVTLPQGLIGFSEFRRFGLAPIPDPRMAQFRLLQCLDQTDLSFLVLPVPLDGSTIADEDVDEACATLGIPRHDVALFLLVTLRKEAEGLSVSMNVRAPIVVDSTTRIARQHVLPNPDYPIRHML